jgi:hypothetical protein
VLWKEGERSQVSLAYTRRNKGGEIAAWIINFLAGPMKGSAGLSILVTSFLKFGHQ